MRTIRITIIGSTLALIAAFVIWPELKSGVLIDRQVREIDRPYGTAYINVCGYFSAIGITYTIVPAEVIPTRKIAEMATCPFNKGEAVASVGQVPGRDPLALVGSAASAAGTVETGIDNIFDQMHDQDPETASTH